MEFDFAPYLNAVLQRIDASADAGYVSTSVDLPLRAEIEDKERQVVDGFDGRGRSSEKRKIVDVIVGLREYAAGHVLLLGKPGAGKSTAFKRLLREEAGASLRDQSRPIPVLLELRRLGTKDAFDGHDVTLLKLILEQLELAGIASEQQVRALLRDRRLLLLLDGLNEMPSSVRLADFRAQFIDTPMIVSSRESVTDFGIETKLHLLPLNDSQARALATNRLGSESAARQLLDDLPDRLHDFTERPLLLNMLCSVYQKSHAIPQNQGELFRRFTHDEYAKHKPSGTVTTRENTFFDFCDEILQEVAFLMMRADGDGKNLWLQVPLVEAEKWLEQRFGERGEANAASKAKQWLSDALNFHLLQPAADHGKIEFIHQAFQEYYAAEWLLRHFDELTDDQFCTHYLNPIKWTESLLILVGIFPDKKHVERFLKLAFRVDLVLTSKLSGSVDYKFQESSFIFVKDSLVERGVREEKLHTLLKFNATKSLIKFLVNFLEGNEGVGLNHSSWFDYADQLRNIDCEESKYYFRKILIEKELDNDLDSREKIRQAIFGLFELHDIKPLIDFLLRNAGDRHELWCAWLYIGKVSNEKELLLLLSAANDENTPNKAKEAIVTAIGNMKTESSLVKLIDFLSDKDRSLRYAAAVGFENSHYQQAINPLLKIIYRNDDAEVCKAAAKALKSIDLTLATNKIITKLLAIEKNKVFSWCREHCDDINNEVGDEFPAVSMKCWEIIGIQVSCIKALGLIGDSKSMPYLIGGLKNNCWNIRSASAEALGKIGSVDAVSFLVDALGDEDDWVRSSVIHALGRISHPHAVKIVFDSFLSSDENYPSWVYNFVNEMQSDDQYSEEFILYSLINKNKKIREVIVEMLWRNSAIAEEKPRIIDALIKVVKSFDGNNSHLAMETLRNINVRLNSDEVNCVIVDFENKYEKKHEGSIPSSANGKVNWFDDFLDVPEFDNVDCFQNEKDAALKIINQIESLKMLPRLEELMPDYDKFDSIYKIQKRHGHYSYQWLERSSALKFLPITKEAKMSNTFNFNASVTAGNIGDNHGTVNVGNNQPVLSAEDIAALRTFLQAWSQHQQSQITENPENSGIDAARTLETENPGLMQRIQNGGIGALTSLIGDMATGEDPISAFIKAFIAGIGGAATRS
ncbi:HEAT repeat domain-containing protein [Thiothrix lacustris]|uniref:HEAT repeat domain-containing protein n=1 Tax=Thiothrix lacustris TaxID=525917 RepID=A0ABY9MTG0_9GAMM|nr:HEAT repeat domain-containing protein [Thiothrix lacustris]WML90665.1 HEAT repeat domain-containing protein [Thiothrix lacustris]